MDEGGHAGVPDVVMLAVGVEAGGGAEGGIRCGRAGIAQRTGFADPEIRLVFLTDLMDTRFDSYGAMLSGIANALEGKESPIVDVDTITDAILMMLAGKLSRDKGGEVVGVADLPDDLGFDGAAFEKAYAAAAKKIYL